MENINEDTKERDEKLYESQNEFMENLVKEAIEHGKEGSANILKRQKAYGIFEAETEGQKLTKEMSVKVVEPLRANRFIVSFPKEFGIPEWNIKSITMPIIEKTKCSDTVIVFNKFIEPLTSKLVIPLMNKKDFIISVKILDCVLKPVEIWDINIKKVVSIDLGGTLEYSDDSIFSMKVTFKTKKCILKD